MNDHATFLRAILAEPDKDLPRLIYADWLDERGDPRGQFIRVQCDIAILEQRLAVVQEGDRPISDGLPLFKRMQDLRHRERELLRSESFDLWRAFCPWGRTSWTMTLHAHRPAFRIGASEATQNIWHDLHRGFVSEITLSWQDWLTHHVAILAACPIANARDGLVRLTTWPVLGPTDVRSLQGSPLGLREWLPFWLDDQWKGVRFELPAARESMTYPTPRGAVTA